jgi:hypothetical protein
MARRAGALDPAWSPSRGQRTTTLDSRALLIEKYAVVQCCPWPRSAAPNNGYERCVSPPRESPVVRNTKDCVLSWFVLRTRIDVFLRLQSRPPEARRQAVDKDAYRFWSTTVVRVIALQVALVAPGLLVICWPRPAAILSRQPPRGNMMTRLAYSDSSSDRDQD